MNNKIGNLVSGLATLVELGCIVALAGIGLKRNKDCYEAEMKLLEREGELFRANVENLKKDYEIEKLEKDIAFLKDVYVKEES